MTCCLEHSTTLRGSVDRAVVVRVVLDLVAEARLVPNHRATHKEHLWVTFIQQAGLVVPLAALYVGSCHVDSIGRGLTFLILHDFEIENELVNRDFVLSGIVLHRTSQETLREEELVDPEERRNALIDPLVEELQAHSQIRDVSSQRFQ